MEHCTLRDDAIGGLSIGGVAYMVGYFPTRKQPALYRHVGVEVDVAAYFRSEAHARAFLDWLVDDVSPLTMRGAA